MHATAALAAASLAARPTPPAVPHDDASLAEGDCAIARLQQTRNAADFWLDDEELDSLWIAVRRVPRPLTDREQTFLTHFAQTAESWVESYATTDEYRAMRRLERIAS